MLIKCSQCSCSNEVRCDGNANLPYSKCTSCGYDLTKELSFNQALRITKVKTRAVHSSITIPLLGRSCESVAQLDPNVIPYILFRTNSLQAILACRLVSQKFKYCINQIINSEYPHSPLFGKAFISFQYREIKFKTNLSKVDDLITEKHQFAIGDRGMNTGIDISISFDDFVKESSTLGEILRFYSKKCNNCPSIKLLIENTEELSQFNDLNQSTGLNDDLKLILTETKIFSNIDTNARKERTKSLLLVFLFFILYTSFLTLLYLSGFKASRYKVSVA